MQTKAARQTRRALLIVTSSKKAGQALFKHREGIRGFGQNDPPRCRHCRRTDLIRASWKVPRKTRGSAQHTAPCSSDWDIAARISAFPNGDSNSLPRDSKRGD